VLVLRLKIISEWIPFVPSYTELMSSYISWMCSLAATPEQVAASQHVSLVLVCYEHIFLDTMNYKNGKILKSETILYHNVLRNKINIKPIKYLAT
jgi:hypothetical protein